VRSRALGPKAKPKPRAPVKAKAKAKPGTAPRAQAQAQAEEHGLHRRAPASRARAERAPRAAATHSRRRRSGRALPRAVRFRGARHARTTCKPNEPRALRAAGHLARVSSENEGDVASREPLQTRASICAKTAVRIKVNLQPARGAGLCQASAAPHDVVGCSPALDRKQFSWRNRWLDERMLFRSVSRACLRSRPSLASSVGIPDASPCRRGDDRLRRSVVRHRQHRRAAGLGRAESAGHRGQHPSTSGVTSALAHAGLQSFRESSFYTTGSFGCDQIFSPSLTNRAGETSSVADGMAGGTLQQRFNRDPSGSSR